MIIEAIMIVLITIVFAEVFGFIFECSSKRINNWIDISFWRLIVVGLPAAVPFHISIIYICFIK